MYFKKICVKIVKMTFEKVVCHDNGLIGTGLINTTLSSSVNFMKSHQISLQKQYSLRRCECLKLVRALCAPLPPCKMGLSTMCSVPSTDYHRRKLSLVHTWNLFKIQTRVRYSHVIRFSTNQCVRTVSYL